LAQPAPPYVVISCDLPGPQNAKIISVEHGPEKKKKTLKPPTGKQGAKSAK
jgi:hypothetical protein